MTLFLCVLKPKPLSRKSFWLKHRGLLGFSRGRAVFLTISCLVGLTCPTWGRPSEVSFLERSSRKGPSSTRLDGSLLGKTNCGIAACCNHCPVHINVNVDFAKIACASMGADIKKLDWSKSKMQWLGEAFQASSLCSRPIERMALDSCNWERSSVFYWPCNFTAVLSCTGLC